MKNFFRKIASNRRLRMGAMSTVIVCLCVAVIVLLNVAVTALEANWNLRYDVTSNKMYSIGDQTKDILKNLSKDVKITTVFQEGAENKLIEEMLGKYKQHSDKLHIENIDPIRNPRAVDRFKTDETTAISAGSVIISNMEETKSRVLDAYSFYETTMDEQTFQTQTTGYKGEQTLTNAIVYIVSENTPVIHFLEGHQESDMFAFSSYRTYFESLNFTVSSLNLILNENTLKKGDILVIAGPKTDMTEAEYEKVKNFMYDGGNIIFMADGGMPSLPNFEALLALLDIKLGHDIVYELSENDRYMEPIYPIPRAQSHDITTVLSYNNLPAVFLNSASFILPQIEKNNVKIEKLFMSSDKAVGKTNFQSTTQEFEEGDLKGPLALGLAVTNHNFNDESKNAKIALFGSVNAFTQAYEIQGNMATLVYTAAWMQNNKDALVIAPKSFSTPILAVQSELQLNLLFLLTVVAIPGIVIAAGIIVFLRRRHL